MTEVVEEAQAGSEFLVRTFDFQAEPVGDGQTIHVRIVPFDEIADVADPPDFRPYKEQFMPGAFSRQMNAANRIHLRSDHNALDDSGQRKSGTAGIVGNGVSLTETQNGYEGEFRFLPREEAQVARELVLAGAYDGVSAEFARLKGGTTRTREGIVRRFKAHLDSVSLARGPAYSKAEILGIREAQDDIIDESLQPPPPDMAMLERCMDLGVAIPESLKILLARAYTEAPWDGSASRWGTPEAYCSAAAIDLNPAGKAKIKDNCHLPYKEPSGEINIGGVRAALSRIGQGFPSDATQPQRDAAKSKLEKILTSFNTMSSSSPAQ